MKGIYPGKEILNSGFNYEALRDNIIGTKIIHIATHGQFLPNNPKESYLLMGTGKTLPIREIEYLRNLGNVHLIVLSACETALGEATQDGKEILGISNYFIGGENKAKAVIASLWVVSDNSTSLLMQLFYKNLATGKMTKSEALRQAQLSLLHPNKSTQANDKQRGGINVEPKPGTPSRNEQRSSEYSHPYYWSPFILIGNGL
jgi:CHAT domain-containing protein